MSTPGSVVDLSVAGLYWRQIMAPSPEQKAYESACHDGLLFAIISRDKTDKGLLWHMSVSWDSNAKYSRCPNWDELKHAKYTLVPADVAMVLIFPRKSAEYVNVHETTLHLWESTEQGIDE